MPMTMAPADAPRSRHCGAIDGARAAPWPCSRIGDAGVRCKRLTAAIATMPKNSAIFDQQEPAVIGAGQRRNAADEIPGIDDAGHEQRGDADDAERREAQRRRARRRERRLRRSPPPGAAPAERARRPTPPRRSDAKRRRPDGRRLRCPGRRSRGRPRPGCRRSAAARTTSAAIRRARFRFAARQAARASNHGEQAGQQRSAPAKSLPKSVCASTVQITPLRQHVRQRLSAHRLPR